MVTWHGPVREQAPPQPAKVELAAGTAVRVTTVPTSNLAEQVEPQSIPTGELVTPPEPGPSSVTVRVCWIGAKLAATLLSVFIVTKQGPVPEQPPPDQPVKLDPAGGVANKSTCVPSSNELEQAPPQSIPAGIDVTPPEPVLVTVRFRRMMKLAVTVVSSFSVSPQVPVPEQ